MGIDIGMTLPDPAEVDGELSKIVISPELCSQKSTVCDLHIMSADQLEED